MDYIRIERELEKSYPGKTLEFKRDLTSPEGILPTAVAFSNTADGRTLIGVEDRTKMVRALRDVLGEEGRL